MIYRLADGDVTKREWIGNKVLYAEALKWFQMSEYESYMERKYIDWMKRHADH